MATRVQRIPRRIVPQELEEINDVEEKEPDGPGRGYYPSNGKRKPPTESRNFSITKRDPAEVALNAMRRDRRIQACKSSRGWK